MLNYLEFLLRDYNQLPGELHAARKLFLVDEDAPSFIVNLIMDTELQPFAIALIDYKLQKDDDNSSAFDVVEIDQSLRHFINDIIFEPELRVIAKTHKNPIWRLAAFFCGFLNAADRYYNAN